MNIRTTGFEGVEGKGAADRRVHAAVWHQA